MVQPDPLPHLSSPDVVGLTLRRRIIDNELSTDSRLLGSKLAEELGVSRTTLRSALLEATVEADTRLHGVLVTAIRDHYLDPHMPGQVSR